MKVLCFGEILWDIIKGKSYIGGALFNLSAHIAKMGGEVFLISSVGDDVYGKRALEKARKYKIKTNLITINKFYPTGTVNVFFTSQGHGFKINENTAWDEIVFEKEKFKKVNEKVKVWDFFCFGSLAQRTKHNRLLLNQILKNIKVKNVFFDINLRQDYYSKNIKKKSLVKSNILKINDEEKVVVSKMFFSKDLDFEKFSKKFSRKFKLDIICITCGEKGAFVYNHKNETSDFIKSEKIKVMDTVGAGDAFSAAFLFYYFHKNNVFKSTEFACKIAGYVASKRGAVPEYSYKIKELFKNF